MIVSIPVPRGWRPLAGVDPKTLGATRLQLHHAAQLVTIAGRSLLPARADDSQTALEWLPEARCFAGEWIGGWRTALRPADLSLQILAKDGTAPAVLSLPGRTFSTALSWLQAEADQRGGGGAKLSRAVPYALDAHPVATGAPFHLEPLAEFIALDHYYGNAFALLSALATSVPEASPIRCWPHHFDLATLISFDAAGGDSVRTIGVGLSPGDAQYGEPYFYVTPWPYPQGVELPALAAGGHWHTAGWTGAVLTASALRAADHGHEAARAAVFLEGAVQACLQLLRAV